MENQKIQENIQKVSQKIAEDYQPEKIILFGSWAWGKPGKNSDIDLLIVKNGTKTRLQMIRDVYDIIFDIGEAIDVLVYTPSQLEKRRKMGDPFIMKIINQGKLLYGAR